MIAFNMEKAIDLSKTPEQNDANIKLYMEAHIISYTGRYLGFAYEGTQEKKRVDVALSDVFSDILIGTSKTFDKKLVKLAGLELSEDDYDYILTSYKLAMLGLVNSFIVRNPLAFKVAFYKFALFLLKDIYVGFLSYRDGKSDSVIEELRKINPDLCREAEKEFEYYMKKSSIAELEILREGMKTIYENLPIDIPTYEEVCNFMGIDTTIESHK